MTHPATVIDGKAMAELWLDDIATQVRAIGVPIHLAAVYYEGDASVEAFVKLKKRAAATCGIEFSSYALGDEASVRQTLTWLSGDDAVHGIFVELPLPDSFDRKEILSLVPIDKDVDLISPAGEQLFYENRATILPPAVVALERVLHAMEIETSALAAAVVGQGMLVGAPVAHWLEQQGSRVVRIDIDTKQPADSASTTDLIVTGTGVPGLITEKWVKQDALVVDFGYAKKGERYVGDVDQPSVKKKAGALTPVPGGMGPLVVAATLENTLALASK